MLKPISHLLPAELYERLCRLPETVLAGLEELRIREDRPLELVGKEKSGFMTRGWSLDRSAQRGLSGRQRDMPQSSGQSDRPFSLRNGGRAEKRVYHRYRRNRIGLAGRTVLEHGEVKAIRDIGAFNIRIAREAVGSADKLAPQLADPCARRFIPRC